MESSWLQVLQLDWRNAMTSREDKAEREDRQERYERRRGHNPIGHDASPPRKRREPYKRESFSPDEEDLEDEWIDD